MIIRQQHQPKMSDYEEGNEYYEEVNEDDACRECGAEGKFWCRECADGESPWILCAEHNAIFHASFASQTHTTANYPDLKHLRIPLYQEYSEKALRIDQDKNTLLTLDLGTNRLEPGKAFSRFTDESFLDQLLPLAVLSFIGMSGTGKSFLTRALLWDESELPVVGMSGSPISTSSDVHLYMSKNLAKNCPTLVFDSEGLGGNCIPLQARTRKVEHNPKIIETRTELIRNILPKLLYLFSDVIICPFSGDPRDETFVTDLMKLRSVTSARIVNLEHLPSLVIIFNRCNDFFRDINPKSSKEDYFELLRKNSSEWSSSHELATNELLQVFSDVHVLFVPDLTRHQLYTLNQVGIIREFISGLLQTKREMRAESQPRTASMLYDMYKLAHKLHANPKLKLDLSTWILSHHVPHQPVVDNLKHCWDLLRISETDMGAALQKFANLVEHVYAIRKRRSRFRVMPGDWDQEMADIRKYSHDNTPCSAELEFSCAEKGTFKAKCGRLRKLHQGRHESVETWGQEQKSRIWGSKVFHEPCIWDGKFKEPSVLNIEFLEYVSKPYDPDFQSIDPITTMRKLNDTVYCLFCCAGNSDTTLTCGHSVCGQCYEEFVSRLGQCAICGTFRVSRTIKQIPNLAGIRVLTLEGGLVRGIIPAIIISVIEFKLGISVCDMFDVIVGSGIGGISALYFGCSGKYGSNPDAYMLPSGPLIREIVMKVLKQKQTLTTVTDKLSSIPFGLGGWLGNAITAISGSDNSMYSQNNLEQMLSEHITGNKLRGCTKSGPLVAAVVTQLEPPYAPHFLSNSFIPSNSGTVDTSEYSALEAAMCTSATPPFFSPRKGWISAEFQTKEYIQETLQICKSLWPGKDVDLLLSLGSGDFGDVYSDQPPPFIPLDGSDKHPLKRLNPKLGMFFPPDIGQIKTLDKIMDEIDKYIHENESLLDDICARIISSCINIEMPERRQSDSKTITFQISPRSDLVGLLSDGLWEIPDASFVLINGCATRKKTFQISKDKKSYSVSFDIDPLEKIDITVYAKTTYGPALISGCTAHLD